MTASGKAPDSIDRIVAHNIRILRLARRLSQGALAERIGTSFQQLQKYESGRNRVTGGRLHLIADVFGVPVKELFRGAPGGREHPKGPSPLRYLAQPLALRLVRAFDRVTDRDLRRVIVALVEVAAGDASPLPWREEREPRKRRAGR